VLFGGGGWGGGGGGGGGIAVWTGSGDPPTVGCAPPQARGDLSVHVAGSRHPHRVDRANPDATPQPRRRAHAPPPRPHLAWAPRPRRGPSGLAPRPHIPTAGPELGEARPSGRAFFARRSWCGNLLFLFPNRMKRHVHGFKKLRCGGPGMPVSCGAESVAPQTRRHNLNRVSDRGVRLGVSSGGRRTRGTELEDTSNLKLDTPSRDRATERALQSYDQETYLEQNGNDRK